MSRFNGWTSAAALDVKTKQQPKLPKYRNDRVQVDGMWFDSKAEARHYATLKIARDAGLLDFERQVPYEFEVVYSANGREVRKKMKYIADFVVAWKDGRVEVQDVKGFRTNEYRLKKKLMSACFGIEIREITKK